MKPKKINGLINSKIILIFAPSMLGGGLAICIVSVVSGNYVPLVIWLYRAIL